MAYENKILGQLNLMLLALLLNGCQTLSGLMPTYRYGADEPTPELQSEIARHEFDLNGDQNMVGEIASVQTQENDTLPDIARHFGLGYNDITVANPAVDAWIPRPNSKVLLPLQFILPDGLKKGIVLNVANMRMFYYPKSEPNKVFTYPVGIGRDGWNTPMGTTSIAIKTPNPEWHVPPSIHREHAAKGHILPSVVRSGPDNPLGLYAMRLAVGSYLIHGTNKPFGIGMQVSHGCVQMYPEDIEVMFEKAKVGMPVRIIHQPYLAAWHNNMLYFEANEPLGAWAGSKKKLLKEAIANLKLMAKNHHVALDMEKAKSVVVRSNGIPTPVLKNSPDLTSITSAAIPLAHPGQLHGQYVAENLDASDWSMLVETFKSENDAKKLAAMLNHQGPPIPARKVDGNNGYHVVAGPFKDKKEAKAVASRIRFDFEMNPKILEPGKSQTVAKAQPI